MCLIDSRRTCMTLRLHHPHNNKISDVILNDTFNLYYVIWSKIKNKTKRRTHTNMLALNEQQLEEHVNCSAKRMPGVATSELGPVNKKPCIQQQQQPSRSVAAPSTTNTSSSCFHHGESVVSLSKTTLCLWSFTIKSTIFANK